jgi:hypothetical protein
MKTTDALDNTDPRNLPDQPDLSKLPPGTTLSKDGLLPPGIKPENSWAKQFEHLPEQSNAGIL